MSHMNLSAKALMAIKPADPERLFSGPFVVKREYHELARKWHPDSGAGDERVFAHISEVYQAALKKADAGDWEYPGIKAFKPLRGADISISYRGRHSGPEGEVYVGDSEIAFALKDGLADLYASGIRQIRGLPYADQEMRDKTAPLMPRVKREVRTKDRCVVSMEKTPDQVLLRDLAGHFGGTLPPEHCAWVCTRLLNIACYLRFAGITHNAISPDTLLVSPMHHAVALTGGWWYSRPVGEKLTAVPEWSVPHLPSGFLRDKVADPRLDLELIRATIRQIVGAKAPRAMASWLKFASDGDALAEYRDWHGRVLEESFGPRKFVKLEVTPADIYSKKD